MHLHLWTTRAPGYERQPRLIRGHPGIYPAAKTPKDIPRTLSAKGDWTGTIQVLGAGDPKRAIQDQNTEPTCANTCTRAHIVAAPAAGIGQQGQTVPPGQGTTRTHHRKRLEKYHKMKKKEQKAQQARRDHEASPKETAVKTLEEVEETGPVGVKAGSSEFIPAQLYSCTP